MKSINEIDFYDKGLENYTNGNTLRLSKDYEASIEAYSNAIEYFEKADSADIFYAAAYIGIGMCKYALNQYYDALDNYILGEKVLVKLGNKGVLMGEHYNRIARLLVFMGDHGRAIEFYEQSARILKDLKPSSYNSTISRLIEVYYFLKDYDTAIKYCNIPLENPSSSVKGILLTVMANSYFHLKEYAKADSVHELNYQRLLLYKNKDVRTSFLENYLLRAVNGIYAGNFEKAYIYLEKANELKDLEKLTTSWKSYLFEVNGNYWHFKAKKEIDKELKEQYLNKGADYYLKGLKTNTHDSLIPYLQKDGGVFEVPMMVVDLFDYLAEVYHEHALLSLDSKREIEYYSKLKEELHIYNALINYIHDYRISFSSEDSRQQLSASQRSAFIKSCEGAYLLYQKTGDYQYVDNLFKVSESGKAASFLAALQDVNAMRFGGIPDSILVLEKRLGRQLADFKEKVYVAQNNETGSEDLDSLNDRLFAAQREYDNLILLLENDYTSYFDFKYANKIISTKELQGELSKNQVLIEYVIGRPDEDDENISLTILAFTHDTMVISVERIPIEEYEQSFTDFYQFLINNDVASTGLDEYNSYVSSAKYLYDKLLLPVLSKLSVTEIIVVPDDKLAYIPFEALITNDPDRDKLDFRNLNYLIKDYGVSYTYSATLLFDYFTQKKRASKDVLALAPDYKGELFDLNKHAYELRNEIHNNLMPLPGAKKEVTNLTEIFSTDTLVGSDAQEGVFKEIAQDYDILHFAMHALVNDSLPMFSKLVFSEAIDNDDGFLNTQEIYSMKLNARLAVLSACNSGTGKLQKGEGVMSLSRAFLYAGCPSVVMTLWEVEDKSGAELMKNFYTYLKKGDSKSEALRKAKLQHLKNADMLKAHPYFWLSYIQVGDSSALNRNYFNVLIFIALSVLVWLIIELLFIKRNR